VTICCRDDKKETIMSDESQAVIATFEDQTAALAVQAVLREAGIEATLRGDVGSEADPDWVAGRMHASGIELVVPAAQVEAAKKALEEATAPPEEGWEETAESAVDGWVCLNCDTVVKQDEPACPTCGALRSEQPQEDDEDEDE
jgi:rubrerythrin